MPVAFVISSPEEDVVNAVSEGAPKPHMDGNLFKFAGVDVKPFLARVGEFINRHEVRSEEYQAGMRLSGRLGSWLGRNIVPEPEPEPQLELAFEPAPEVPVDGESSDDVPKTQRRRRVVS